MIDYNKNLYVKVGNFTNVVNEIPKDQISDTNKDKPSWFHGFLDPLIDKLALHHPEWTLVGEDSWYSHVRESFTIKCFRIYEKDEELGTVKYDDWKGEKFRISNKRISTSMKKRSAMETKDLNKALKIIADNFGSKSMTERVSEAMNNVTSAISNNMWRKRRTFDETVGKLAQPMVAYVVENMETMGPILEARGVSSAVLARLPQELAEYRNFNAVSTARNSNTGATVVLYEDRYIVKRDEFDEALILTASQLSPEMSAKIGVMKIVDNEAVVESVGMRINSSTFYLLP